MARKRSKVSKNGNLNHHQEFNDVDVYDDIQVKATSIPRRRQVEIKCKNKKQKDFLRTIEEHDITLCCGPAGCGKSYLSIVKALKYLFDPNSPYEKIFIITPLVEVEERIGSLPGDLNEKTQPYINSSYRLIDKILDNTFGKGKGKVKREEMILQGQIEVLALAYLRGENIDNAILIFEEAQNASKNQMKTLLTRIGENAKFIISGDIKQIDRFKNSDDSGLKDAVERFEKLEEIGQIHFSNGDSVRHQIINKLLEYYD